MIVRLWKNLIMIYKNVFYVTLILLLLSSCSNNPCINTSKNTKLSTLSKDDPGNVVYKGHYKVGSKYKIKGRTYKPKEVTRYKKIGVASWYGERDGFHGKKTANGDVFNKNLLTAAHKSLPLPCLIKVTNIKTNKSVILMANDRGPFAHNREIDVSARAAEVLGFKRQGVAKVRVEYLHKETNDFLKNIGLKRVEGAKVKKAPNAQCTINCHVKIANLKHLKRS